MCKRNEVPRGEWFMSGDRMWVLPQSTQRQHNKNIHIHIWYIYIELKRRNTFGAWWNNWPARLDLKWPMADALHSNVNFGWFNTTFGFLLNFSIWNHPPTHTWTYSIATELDFLVLTLRWATRYGTAMAAGESTPSQALASLHEVGGWGGGKAFWCLFDVVKRACSTQMEMTCRLSEFQF